jgi:hypothetical protein
MFSKANLPGFVLCFPSDPLSDDCELVKLLPIAVVRELLKQPLAYQLRLLFMEFKVNVDKAKHRKVNEVKGFIFIVFESPFLCSKKKIFIFRGESSEISRGSSQMIGRLMGHEERRKEKSGNFSTVIRAIKA